MNGDLIEPCFICTGECSGHNCGVPVYEDEIVLESKGSRSTCRRCYYLVNGYFATHPDMKSIPRRLMMTIIKQAPENESLRLLAQRISFAAREQDIELHRVRKLLGKTFLDEKLA